MATYKDAKCRLCRREGEKLFLKGDKCYSVKCTIVSKNYIPGQHGPKAKRSRLSEFGVQLREKQKVKRVYGILEDQFREYIDKAKKNQTETGDALLRLLEQRLDNIVYKLGFAPSLRSARQMVGHGQIKINDKTVSIPSYQTKIGQSITMAKKWADKKEYLKNSEDLMTKRGLPEWLSREGIEGKIESLPDVTNLKNTYNTSIIIEFYSRN